MLAFWVLLSSVAFAPGNLLFDLSTLRQNVQTGTVIQSQKRRLCGAFHFYRVIPNSKPHHLPPLIEAARGLGENVASLHFASPVAFTYNPLEYAWAPHAEYLYRFGQSHKRVVFLGMNPGPFGMVQTGIPFGEVAAVREWLGISAPVNQPAHQHPKRPILGFDCPRSEVSGRRLWSLFAARFKSADAFFKDHFVANYCPLAFVEESGANRTPDKLPTSERDPLFAACDLHLRRMLEILQPEWIIGVGAFAATRAAEVAGELKIQSGQILHPSPASPLANRDWSGTVTRQLVTLGVWR